MPQEAHLEMPSSRASWQICKNLRAASLDKEEPGSGQYSELRLGGVLVVRLTDVKTASPVALVSRPPRPPHRDLRDGAVHLAEVVGRRGHVNRSDVLLQALQLAGAWDGNDPWLLGKQPGQRDLGRCRGR